MAHALAVAIVADTDLLQLQSRQSLLQQAQTIHDSRLVRRQPIGAASLGRCRTRAYRLLHMPSAGERVRTRGRRRHGRRTAIPSLNHLAWRGRRRSVCGQSARASGRGATAKDDRGLGNHERTGRAALETAQQCGIARLIHHVLVR